jgi:type II secretory pathway pseudopilin PulG
MQKKRKSFTLLELLVAVAIFSGLAILTLGIFARSAASSLKSGETRRRTEVARSVIDRITNDLRYVYLNEQITNEQGQGNCVQAGGEFVGYDFSDSCLKIVLKYPRSTDYVYKVFNIEPTGDITLKEHRGCTVRTQGNSRVLSCAESSPAVSILSNGYKVETGLIGIPFFSGSNPKDASAPTPPTVPHSPFIRLSFTFKPIDITAICTSAEVRAKCYSVSTTITTGGSR